MSAHRSSLNPALPGHDALHRQNLLAGARAKGDAASTGRHLQWPEHADLVRIGVVVVHVSRTVLFDHHPPTGGLAGALRIGSNRCLTLPLIDVVLSHSITRLCLTGPRASFPQLPALAHALLAISARVVDLHPVAANRYYHPRQQGSWSIKAVLPAVAPDLAYEQLEGVRNGGMAMEAYREAIAPATPSPRRAQIKSQLLDYCKLDTFAMVRMWQHFTGRGQTN